MKWEPFPGHTDSHHQGSCQLSTWRPTWLHTLARGKSDTLEDRCYTSKVEMSLARREAMRRSISFYSGNACPISPAACSLEWHPKPWPQATRHWSWAFSLEWLGIWSVCTSETCSWIQNFVVDSGTWQSLGTVSTDWAWRGYSPSFLRRSILLINTAAQGGEGASAPLRQREWGHV